jgi:hypothetical protein
MGWNIHNNHIIRCIMHCITRRPQNCFGSGHGKEGHGTEQVHAYLWLEFDCAVRSDITHCLNAM